MQRIRTMKHTFLLAGALLALCGAEAQEAGRIHRTERVPYSIRKDAEAGDPAASGHRIAFAPSLMAGGDAVTVVGSQVEIPFVWTDGNVYLHLENVRSAYSLWLNGSLVGEVEDPATPAQFALTPWIRQGKNEFRLLLRESRTPQIDPEPASRTLFEGSYLYYQDKRSIRDFEIALVPDTAGRNFGMLRLAVVAQNSFNYDEPVEVGYDIYSPQGKLLDFNMREVTVAGRSVDTVRFEPYIYGAYDNKWEGGARTAPLYKVMLFTRRNGAYKEYMPLRVGFGETRWEEGRLMRLGKEVVLKQKVCNAAATPEKTLAELRRIKAEGYNTVAPQYPQPAWFYDLCDRTGLYVIDCAAIDAPEGRSDRTVGGTPSNDPALADEYLERVKAMYYRSRNFTCVVAYSLGNPSGNGYNMYKAYRWLKSVEKARPVIYTDADGEWNTDL